MSDHLIVRADVDETDIGNIKVDQSAVITVDAYPNDRIEGRVNHIAFDSKTTNSVTVYQVDILPKQVPEFMRSGMTANVSFNIEKRENVLVVPQEAVHFKNQKKTVRVRDKASQVIQEIDVELGLSDGKKVEVVSGLNEGSEIVIPKINSSDRKRSGTNPFAPMRGPRK